MGASHGDFIKYPRTPHLFGSKGTADDKRLGLKESLAFIANPSLIVEEKLDGTNVGIHFTSPGKMFLQCRGHEITSGMHPQYDLFKQWTTYARPTFEYILKDRFILFGEWLYAVHSVSYTKLSHYFFEFDIYDKEKDIFLTLADRRKLLTGSGIQTVPVIHVGSVEKSKLNDLIGDSAFGAMFENPISKKVDHRMEGLYLRTESENQVDGRAKFVRPEFIQKVVESEHWQHQAIKVNGLAEDVNIWR